jgi:HPt (histidine-containing phosphotransfer) domain-containing protein
MPTVFPPGAAGFLDLSATLPSGGTQLHPTRILDATHDGCVVECEASAALTEGTPLRLLYAGGQQLRQESMRITSVRMHGSTLRMELAPVGAVQVGSERRSSPRLSCAGTNLRAQLDGAEGHPVVDLGLHGFAVHAAHRLHVGDVMRVSLHHDNDSIPCTVVVKNVRELSQGGAQYGVFCENPHDGTSPWRLTDLYGALRHGVLEPLRSAFESDPDMADLIREFAVEILQFASEAERLVEQRDWSELRVLSHTLKGAGGGYGFDRITEVSGDLERAIAQKRPLGEVENLAGKLCATLRAVRVTAQA